MPPCTCRHVLTICQQIKTRTASVVACLQVLTHSPETQSQLDQSDQFAKSISGLCHPRQHQDREGRGQARSRLQRFEGEERPRILDLRSAGRPYSPLQLEREAAVPLLDS